MGCVFTVVYIAETRDRRGRFFILNGVARLFKKSFQCRCLTNQYIWYYYYYYYYYY
jgi:hypothetical protein